MHKRCRSLCTDFLSGCTNGRFDCARHSRLMPQRPDRLCIPSAHRLGRTPRRFGRKSPNDTPLRKSTATRARRHEGCLAAGNSPSREAFLKNFYVAIGIDCDPDRASYPERLTWRGVEQLPRLLELDGVKWTLNVRADTQIRDYCGSAGYCYERYRPLWDAARQHGSVVAWHLHYYDGHGRQDTSERNILQNIEVGSEALGHPDVVHMGWTYQNDFSIRHLYDAGVRIDYSPVPRMQSPGRGGVDAYDWSRFSCRPVTWHGVRMIPAYTFRHRLLQRRFRTERVMLTTTTAPLLYRMLLKECFRTGADFFVSYFHADELVPALGDWRDRLYTARNLRVNLRLLRDMAAREGYDVTYVNMRELAGVLFDDALPRTAPRRYGAERRAASARLEA